MAAVFLMQPLGQLCAYCAGITALHTFGSSKAEVDKLWRYVVGVGAIPTLLALLFRLSMPESGRYTYEVRRNSPTGGSMTQIDDSGVSINSTPSQSENAPSMNHLRFGEIWAFLRRDGHGVALFGTSICWLLLDFAFCK